MLVLYGYYLVSILGVSLLAASFAIRQRRVRGDAVRPNGDEDRKNSVVSEIKTSNNWSLIMVVLVLVTLLGYYTLKGNIVSSENITSKYSKSGHYSSNDTTCPPVGANLLGIYGTTPYHRKISTKSIESQQLFDQGLVHLFGFNYIEARRNFEACLLYDTDCAMCYYGVAYTYGSSINNHMSYDEAKLGRKYINIAIDKIAAGKNATAVEHDLILTYSTRFPLFDAQNYTDDVYKADYDRLESDIIASFFSLKQKYARDVDVLSLYAESIITFNRWKYFDNKGVTLKSVLPAVEALEDIFAITLAHPLANHLWIHITEQSSNPCAGVVQADSLVRIFNGSGTTHLLHMPAHTYSRCGLYHQAIATSVNAINADNYYVKQCLEPYVPLHNIALLIESALAIGDFRLASQYAVFTIPEMPDESSKYVSALFPIAQELILLRQKKFRQILQHYLSDDAIMTTASRPPYIQSLFYYVHTLSCLWVDDKNKLFYYGKFMESQAKIPASDDFVVGHVFYPYLVEIGTIMNLTIAAAYNLHGNQTISAINELQRAVEIQDSFNYMEPEHYYLPVRHCLGAVELHHYDVNVDKLSSKTEALIRIAGIYSDDLHKHPNNAWAMLGLRLVLIRLQLLEVNEKRDDLIGKLVNITADVTLSPAMQSLRGTCCELNLC
jgi:tetratricopeptide (TPR) repeat protein